MMTVNPLGFDAVPFGGLRIIEDQNMVDAVEDWSRVRSPSRAIRRRRQGHRQNIDIVCVPKKDAYRVGDAFVMHPIMAAELRRKIANGETE